MYQKNHERLVKKQLKQLQRKNELHQSKQRLNKRLLFHTQSRNLSVENNRIFYILYLCQQVIIHEQSRQLLILQEQQFLQIIEYETQ